MATLVNCPSCQRKLKVPDELLGKKVKCPGCSTIFMAEEFEESAPPEEEARPRPRRPVQEEEDFEEEERPQKAKRKSPPPEDEYEEDDDRPRSRRRHEEEEDDDRPRSRQRREEEDEDDDRPRSRRRPPEDDDYDDKEPPPRRRKKGPDSLSPSYSIDFGEWFGYAKAHYSSVWGPMIGYMFVYGAINFAINLLGAIPFVGMLVGLGSFLVLQPLLAGFTVVALAQLKGKRWSFGDFFSGFNWFGPIVLNTLLNFVIAIACLIPSIAVAILAVVGSMAAKNPTFLIIAGAFCFINLLAAWFVLARATFFSEYLIIDRGYGPVEALQGSWNLGRGHMLGLVGIMLLCGLMVMGGFILCFVGALFVAPLVIMTKAAGYLLVAGKRPPRRSPSGSRYDSEDD